MHKVKSNPTSVVEPTCGKGVFLLSAKDRWPHARYFGLEINEEYAKEARSHSLPVLSGDFFEFDWSKKLDNLPDPILILGNPPWVTVSKLGSMGVDAKSMKEFQVHSGLDAITGKANSDLSEWVILHLLSLLRGREFEICLLCKHIVARRVLEYALTRDWNICGEVYGIDASHYFDVSTSAVLLVIRSSDQPSHKWEFYPDLDSISPASHWGFVSNRIVPNLCGYHATRDWEGLSEPSWRSGVKHDCAEVFEFDHSEVEGLESGWIFPLMKGSDIANKRWPPSRRILLTQSKLNEDTTVLETQAPNIWSYLALRKSKVEARKSRIYRGKPPFSIFGVGPYTYYPWKIAIAGMYKHLKFMLLPPYEGKPVILDDTSYLLPFDSEKEAREALEALNSEEAIRFFHSRVFWEDKRPINKSLLNSFDWTRHS